MVRRTLPAKADRALVETKPISWALMSSFKQIEANRRNALKSTGPTTAKGKRRSRCNAVRHGLTAETVITSLEDSDDYEAFEATVIADYDANSAVERELVLRLASALWRLRRATAVETALFEAVTAELDEAETSYSGPQLIDSVQHSKQNQVRSAEPQSDPKAPSPRKYDTENNIADGFLRLLALPTFPLDRLSRYECLLWRQARQLVFTLESLRRRRPANRFNFPFPLGR